MIIRKRGRRSAQGGVIVEFAGLLTVLLVLALPLADYGRAILAHIALNDDARSLADWLTREPANNRRLALRLLQAVNGLPVRHGLTEMECYSITQLEGKCADGMCAATIVAREYWSPDPACSRNLLNRSAAAKRTLPTLNAGSTAYVVEASARIRPIFANGVLGVGTPDNHAHARVVFTARND